MVRKDGDDETVISGLTGLVVLKSTGSEFWGFPDVEYTSLVETDDRMLATAVTARWRYIGSDIDWDKTFTAVRNALLEEFATTHSLSLQQTLYAMGRAVPHGKASPRSSERSSVAFSCGFPLCFDPLCGVLLAASCWRGRLCEVKLARACRMFSSTPQSVEPATNLASGCSASRLSASPRWAALR